MNRRIFISTTTLALLLPTSVWANETSNPALQKSHIDIVEDHPSVSHISAAQLSNQTDLDVVFLDVREMKEFEVSHLDGAYQVPPAISPKDFMSEFDLDWSGKTVVFYCSVGRRSSILAERVQANLKANGAEQVYNLEEGIFGWHNAALPLSDESGETDLVHPYNAFWKRMVNRKALAKYKPAP